MKSLFYLVPGIVLSMMLPHRIFAQCGSGQGPYTVQYDTTVYGTGSNSYSFTFPKFNIPLGILISADVKSKINLELNYTLENTTGSNVNYNAKVLRSDDISSTEVDVSSMGVVNTVSNINYVPLAAHQFVSYGPLRKSYVANDSIILTNPDLNNYQGVGNLNFDYVSTTTSVLPPGGVNFLANVKDTVRFSISYLYCLPSVLSQDILFFTAVPQAKGKALLSWSQQNIQAGRIYNAQVSTDGRNFTNITSVAENNNGNYAYTYLHNATSRLYFRIEERDINGVVKYSVIRIIDPEQSKTGLQVYPTLYQGGNIQLGFSAKGDWQADFYSAEGRKVFESLQKDAYNAQLTLPANISNGVYTVVVANKQTLKREVARIVVQR